MGIIGDKVQGFVDFGGGIFVACKTTLTPGLEHFQEGQPLAFPRPRWDPQRQFPFPRLAGG